MIERGQGVPRRPGFVPRLALLLACVPFGGCVGPSAVRYTRLRYNEVYRATNDEQLLINIVRLRYADSPVFIDLPNITSQFEASGQGNYTGGVGYQFPGTTNLGLGQLGLRDTPTLSYHPREGRDIAKSLLTPISADLFSVVNAGATTEQLLLLTVNDINDVTNAPRATSMAPRSADNNAFFRHGIQLIEALQDQGALELVLGTTEETETSSDPIPAGELKGGDLLHAAMNGYVFRMQGKNEMTTRKRERGLVLKIRPEFIHSREMEGMAAVFHLTPGLDHYRIKSEVTEEGTKVYASGRRDTIYLNMRSILQILIFLSKGVCVPEEHQCGGIAPITVGPDGQPYDWTQVTAGHFIVHFQKHRPRNAEVAVHYRGYWFYIPRNDVSSRAMLAIVEILFDLQESGDRSVGPLLTLPLGG